MAPPTHGFWNHTPSTRSTMHTLLTFEPSCLGLATIQLGTRSWPRKLNNRCRKKLRQVLGSKLQEPLSLPNSRRPALSTGTVRSCRLQQVPQLPLCNTIDSAVWRWQAQCERAFCARTLNAWKKNVRDCSPWQQLRFRGYGNCEKKSQYGPKIFRWPLPP